MSKKKDYRKQNNKHTSSGTRGCNERRSRGSTKNHNSGNDYTGNHISWYTQHPDLVEAAAKIPFAYQPGRSIPVKQYGSDYESAIEYPGIMCMDFVPSVGYSDEVQSPINVAARELYGRIRKNYSGSLEADAPDLMMYVLAVDALNMMIEDAKRAYYLINQYTPYNTMVPKGLINMLGWDFDDLQSNKVLFYQYINTAVAMTSRFLVPDYMPIIQRHAFLNANLFFDSPSAKAQIYCFKAKGIHQLDDVDTTTKLKFTIYHGDENITVEDWWSKFNSAISQLMNWDTSYTIVGYLQRAYQDGKFLVPSPVLQNAVIQPVYDEMVALQIHNLTSVPIVTDMGFMDITQDVEHGNVLVHTPRALPYGDIKLLEGTILDMPGSAQPSAAETIIATRLSSVIKEDDPIDRNDVAIDGGTEIVVGFTVSTDQEGFGAGEIFETTSFRIGANDQIGSGDIQEYVQSITKLVRTASLMSTFDWHPTLVAFQIQQSGETDIFGNTVYPISQLENFTHVDSATIANLHRMCIYSEFDCFRPV